MSVPADTASDAVLAAALQQQFNTEANVASSFTYAPPSFGGDFEFAESGMTGGGEELTELTPAKAKELVSKLPDANFDRIPSAAADFDKSR